VYIYSGFFSHSLICTGVREKNFPLNQMVTALMLRLTALQLKTFTSLSLNQSIAISLTSKSLNGRISGILLARAILTPDLECIIFLGWHDFGKS